MLGGLFGRPVAPVGHELIEFRLVLGLAQALQEVAELALLIFEAPQRLGPVFVEGAVAAGAVTAPPVAPALRVPLNVPAHAIHLFLQALHFTLPAIAVIPAAHSSAPDDECEDHEADRPPPHEAEDHEKDPGWPS